MAKNAASPLPAFNTYAAEVNHVFFVPLSPQLHHSNSMNAQLLRDLGFRIAKDGGNVVLPWGLPSSWQIQKNHFAPRSSHHLYLYLYDGQGRQRAHVLGSTEKGTPSSLTFMTFLELTERRRPGHHGQDTLDLCLSLGRKEDYPLVQNITAGKSVEHLKTSLGAMITSVFPDWGNPRAYWDKSREKLAPDLAAVQNQARDIVEVWKAAFPVDKPTKTPLLPQPTRTDLRLQSWRDQGYSLRQATAKNYKKRQARLKEARTAKTTKLVP